MRVEPSLACSRPATSLESYVGENRMSSGWCSLTSASSAWTCGWATKSSKVESSPTNTVSAPYCPSVCAGAAAQTLGQYGAETVFVGDDSTFDDFVAQPHVHALEALVKEHQPELILFSPTYDSRDVAGRLQARLGSTLMSNATDVLAPDYAQTQIFGGSQVVDVTLSGPEP